MHECVYRNLASRDTLFKRERPRLEVYTLFEAVSVYPPTIDKSNDAPRTRPASE